MKDFSRELFRHGPQARLAGPDGSEWTGRGYVARQKEPSGLLSQGQRHEAGLLENPLFVFTGWAGPAQAGGTLEQGGTVYTILKAEEMGIGGTKVCARLILERQVEGHDGP